MRRLRKLLWPMLLLSLSLKAFVPVGMMVDIASYMRGGNLVIFCSSAGDLPWMPIQFDHDDEIMDGMDDGRCPYAALHTPTQLDTDTFKAVTLGAELYAFVSPQAFYSKSAHRRGARGPPSLKVLPKLFLNIL